MKEIVSTPTDSFPLPVGVSLSLPLSLFPRLSLSPSFSFLPTRPYIRTAIAPSLSRLLSLYRGIGGAEGVRRARGVVLSLL